MDDGTRQGRFALQRKPGQVRGLISTPRAADAPKPTRSVCETAATDFPAPLQHPILPIMGPPRILHLVPDEKFIDFFHGVCLKAGGAEHSFYLDAPPDRQLRHIRTTPIRGRVDLGDPVGSPSIAEMAAHDCIVAHFMSDRAAAVLAGAPHGPAVVWSGWGADYVDLVPGGRSALLGPMTRSLERAKYLEMLGRRPVQAIRGYLRPPWARLSRGYRWRAVLRRTDYFSAPIESDYSELKMSLRSRFPAAYVQLNYGSAGQSCHDAGLAPDAHDILVGNSASATSNHLEVFVQLAASDLRNRRVIVPLSYGDPWYRDRVCEEGRKILGSSFHPLLDFMPLEKYLQLQRRCSVAIFNHVRQQALGNIMSTMTSGARVVMNARSPVFRMLARLGARLDTTGNAKNPIDLSPLPAGDAEANREVVWSIWGDDVVLRNFREFLRVIEEHRTRPS
jgi:dTDP-N-acetylfucosamine:lipid II N-acetylfucosaminyltransferase